MMMMMMIIKSYKNILYKINIEQLMSTLVY